MINQIYAILLVTSLGVFLTQQQTNIPTTGIPSDECSIHSNGTCAECISSANCLYCYEDSSCVKLKFDGTLPDLHGCKLSKARWSVCFLDLQALIISVSVIGGVLLLIVPCCICYCCCKACRSATDRKLKRVEEKLRKEKAERDERATARKAERAERYNDIRIKYGLQSGKQYAKVDE